MRGLQMEIQKLFVEIFGGGFCANNHSDLIRSDNADARKFYWGIFPTNKRRTLQMVDRRD